MAPGCIGTTINVAPHAIRVGHLHFIEKALVSSTSIYYMYTIPISSITKVTIKVQYYPVRAYQIVFCNSSAWGSQSYERPSTIFRLTMAIKPLKYEYIAYLPPRALRWLVDAQN